MIDVLIGLFYLSEYRMNRTLVQGLIWKIGGTGLTHSGFSLKVIVVMRPCDGTSGLVRGNRRKAVFAFKGCFPRGICRVLALRQWVFIAVFGSAGKNRKPPSTPRFLATKPQVAEG